ncbi:MAG TPA: hypothetical protein VFA27_17590, partial [Vicinamibacterales bacterium]|nr:hypothetical protein [Vicinamibacterales bacterium]
MDEAFRFAICLRAVRPREAPAHHPAPTNGGEDTGAVHKRVVGEQPANPNAATMKPHERALEEGGAGPG